MKLGLDIIGRDESYYKIEIDKNFPEFLTKNINKFKEFIVWNLLSKQKRTFNRLKKKINYKF